MTEAQTTTRPDTTDLIAVHGVFRDALDWAPGLIGDVPARDLARAAVVGSYYDNVLRFLTVHHDGEDALIWPKLAERAPGRTDLVDEMWADHERIHDTLQTAADVVARWTSSADPAAGRQAVSALQDLAASLLPHLDHEDEQVVPLCAEHLSPEEWAEMPGHALRAFDGDKVWLILGLIRENMTQEQRDAMLAHMPPPPRDMWINMGRDAFEQFIAQVRDDQAR